MVIRVLQEVLRYSHVACMQSPPRKELQMKRILIVYATREGQTEKIAGFLTRELQTLGASVDLLNAADKQAAVKDLLAYDLVVLGASLHAGHVEKELVAYIRTNLVTLQSRTCRFFLVLMAAATEDLQTRKRELQDAQDMVRKQLPMDVGPMEMIAGALSYTKYNWFIKWTIKRISAKYGGATDTSRDHEYTDWDQVRRYAQQLLQA
jgi:menaquinone-dependent protoporphyrinogen oxidase